MGMKVTKITRRGWQVKRPEKETGGILQAD